MENRKEQDLFDEAQEKIEIMTNSNNVMIILMVLVICEFILWQSNYINLTTYCIITVVCYFFYFYHRFKYNKADKRVIEILNEIDPNK
jgi:Ca2+/Na+ antiporter